MVETMGGRRSGRGEQIQPKFVLLFFFNLHKPIFMSHSLHKIWIHAIWATKDRAHLLNSDIEPNVHNFISEQLKNMGCHLWAINGMPDHVHCLFLLNAQKSISQVMKQIKGSSAHYANQNNLISGKFSWQTGYAAFSVSESGVNRVKQYIQNQKSHHQKQTFEKEYERFEELHLVSHG